MSGQCTGWVLRHGPRDRVLRAVLFPIADAANRDGDHAHPGQEAIIDGSLYKRSAVTKAIRELIEQRWIEVEEWSSGPGQATVYRVLMDRPPTTPEPITKRPTNPKSEPDKGAILRPLSTRKAAAPATAASGPERGHDDHRKGPLVTAKGATAPTWDRSPTVFPTETLPTRCATNPVRSFDAPTPAIRAGVEVETQETPIDLLAAVAQAAPRSARHQLLDDPDQAAGRAALRHRLDALAAQLGPDAAVAVVAGEWPAAVASPMAHANARARAALGGHPVTVTPATHQRPPDPLDGITDAAAAIAERSRAREAEVADEPRLTPPPSWKDDLRARLYAADAEHAEVSL